MVGGWWLVAGGWWLVGGQFRELGTDFTKMYIFSVSKAGMRFFLSAQGKT